MPPAFRTFGLLVAAMSAGCGVPPLPIEYETAHLRIGTDFDYRLCQGNLHSFEQTIAFIEDDLRLDLRRSVDVYLWSQAGWDSLGINECKRSDYVFGCYSHDDATVHATTYSLRHELVHAVVGAPELDVFFSEGIADAYAGRVLPFGESAPSANVGTNHDNFDSRAASHFSRWLRERWGGHKLGELVTSQGSAFGNFQKIYGISLEEAEVMYFEEAPAIYASLYSCKGPEVAIPGVAVSHVELACDQSDTFSGPSGLYSRRTIVVSEEGRYSFATNAAWISAYRCAEDLVTDYLFDEKLQLEDIPPEYAGYPSPAARYFEGGIVHTVALRKGRYDFTIAIDGFAPGSAEIAIWPSLSPGPVGTDGP